MFTTQIRQLLEHKEGKIQKFKKQRKKENKLTILLPLWMDLCTVQPKIFRTLKYT